MSDPVFQLIHQYVVAQHMTTHKRPYLVREGVTQELGLDAFAEKLPEPNLWRVTLELSCTGEVSGELAFEVSSKVEGIVVSEGLSLEDTRNLLSQQIGTSLFATCRSQLSMLTAQSGYGPLVVPVIEAGRIASKVAFLESESAP